jgi:hypothetical protein
MVTRMKQLICIAILLLLPFGVFAVENQVSPTATVTPTKNKQVEDLKERLATKVAQLSQSERRAIYGTVKTTTISTLTIETASKDIKIELTDDIKVFQMLKGKRTALTTDDVAKGDIVSVFGDWDTAVEVLKAKVIFIHSTNEGVQRVFGTITEAKKSDYTITMSTKDGKTYMIDFEVATKTNVWTKEKGIEKDGFSKLIPGDIILVVGTPVPKKDNRISALRILNIGNLTGEKPSPTPTPATAEKEATGSSAKLTPPPAKSPTPTPKP